MAAGCISLAHLLKKEEWLLKNQFSQLLVSHHYAYIRLVSLHLRMGPFCTAYSNKGQRSSVQNLQAFSSKVTDGNQLNTPLLTPPFTSMLETTLATRQCKKEVFGLSVQGYSRNVAMHHDGLRFIPFLLIDPPKSYTLFLNAIQQQLIVSKYLLIASWMLKPRCLVLYFYMCYCK